MLAFDEVKGWSGTNRRSNRGRALPVPERYGRRRQRKHLSPLLVIRCLRLHVVEVTFFKPKAPGPIRIRRTFLVTELIRDLARSIQQDLGRFFQRKPAE